MSAKETSMVPKRRSQVEMEVHTENLCVSGHLGGAEARKIVGKARLGFETSSSKCGYREAGSAGAEGTCEVLERQLDGGSGGNREEWEKRSRSRRLEGECRGPSRSERGQGVYLWGCFDMGQV